MRAGSASLPLSLSKDAKFAAVAPQTQNESPFGLETDG
jgi:hypothetical protein